MANERLRGCLSASGLTTLDAATTLVVDPKTVERWVAGDRMPHSRHRVALAALLGVAEAYLWPQLLDDPRTQAASEAELVTLYPQRGAVPVELWRNLLGAATERIDVLVFAGLFLLDGMPELADVLAEKAALGVAVRFAVGDPASDAVRVRGAEEGIGHGVASRVQLSRTFLIASADVDGVEVREHGTTLYNSLFRFDDQLLVNAHVYGAPASRSPVLHLRRVPGGRMFDHYVTSFERVWALASVPPLGGDSANQKVS